MGWDVELYEIQVPGGDEQTAAALENDTLQVPDQGSPNGYDLNLHYGRVLYTYGQALDKPLSVIRMRYADRKAGVYSVWPSPFALIPHWNMRGQAQRGSFASGYSSLCRNLSGAQRCVTVDWPQGWFPYAPARQIPENWHGSLITEKQDASGLYYRRNRYYDPATGRFTQEDPIGLAGGVNVYGYADGDPVSYSDPYGLNPCLKLGKAAAFAAVAASSDLALPVGDIVGVACLATAVFATVALAATVSDAVDVDIGRRRESPQALYHRAAGPVETQQVVESGEVWGAPMRNIFASDIPKVKPSRGLCPRALQGMNGNPRHPWATWSGRRPDVAVTPGGDFAKIPVTVTKIQP